MQWAAAWQGLNIARSSGDGSDGSGDEERTDPVGLLPFWQVRASCRSSPTGICLDRILLLH